MGYYHCSNRKGWNGEAGLQWRGGAGMERQGYNGEVGLEWRGRATMERWGWNGKAGLEWLDWMWGWECRDLERWAGTEWWRSWNGAVRLECGGGAGMGSDVGVGLL